jgi:hypothetical protein
MTTLSPDVAAQLCATSDAIRALAASGPLIRRLRRLSGASMRLRPGSGRTCLRGQCDDRLNVREGDCTAGGYRRGGYRGGDGCDGGGMAAAQARQDHLMQNARDGHAGDLREAPSTLEPFFPSDRGDGPGV